jgi:hypothetical protein
MNLRIIESPFHKRVESEIYNFRFDKQTGFFMRWGKTLEDDPKFAPAPEILDLEISSGGDCLGKCPFCYKGNGTGDTHNMTLDEFKIIFSKFPRTLTQIAFGIMNISTNPDFFAMMEYAKNHGVIPNYTCHGLDVTPEVARKTAALCGAVAVSLYDKQKSYDAIKMFADAGMKQVNIHYMLSKETLQEAFDVIDDIKSDSRLQKLNAIVFLHLKKKGRARGDKYHYIDSVEDYKKLIEYAEASKVGIGFDSCSAPLYMKSIEDRPNYEQLLTLAEPCESSLFSSYINCYGKFFPCSFAEGVANWEDGLDVLNCSNFVKDIWGHENTKSFREKLINSSESCVRCPSMQHCRTCPLYDITMCKE